MGMLSGNVQSAFSQLPGWLNTVSQATQVPCELILNFPFTSQCVLMGFVAYYRGIYRKGQNDVYISYMFREDRYGISITYGLCTAFAEVQNLFNLWKRHTALQDNIEFTKGAPEESRNYGYIKDEKLAIRKSARNLFVRWGFALTRAYILNSIFSFHTDEHNLEMQSIHGTGVKYLVTFTIFQWFAVQLPGYDLASSAGRMMAATSFFGFLAIFLGYSKVSGSIDMSQPPAERPAIWCWVSCMLETASLALSMPRTFANA